MRLLTEFAGYYRIAGHEEYEVGPIFGVTFDVGLHSALGLSVFGAVGHGSDSGGLMARYRRFLPGGWVAEAAVGPTLWGTRSGIVGDISLLYKDFVGYSIRYDNKSLLHGVKLGRGPGIAAFASAAVGSVVALATWDGL